MDFPVGILSQTSFSVVCNTAFLFLEQFLDQGLDAFLSYNTRYGSQLDRETFVTLGKDFGGELVLLN